jgi:hypothetical protein
MPPKLAPEVAKSRKLINDKWAYKKQFAPPRVLSEWERICNTKEGKNSAKTKFITEAAQVTGTIFESDFFEKLRSAAAIDAAGSEWEWVSWNLFEQQEGKEVALEMVASGTIESRPHPGLKPDTKLMFPHAHQFRKVTKKGSSMRVEKEGVHEKSGPVCGNREIFNSMIQLAHGKAACCHGIKRKTPGAPAERNENQLATQGLRACRSKLEQNKRDFEVTVKKSKTMSTWWNSTKISRRVFTQPR